MQDLKDQPNKQIIAIDAMPCECEIEYFEYGYYAYLQRKGGSNRLSWWCHVLGVALLVLAVIAATGRFSGVDVDSFEPAFLAAVFRHWIEIPVAGVLLLVISHFLHKPAADPEQYPMSRYFDECFVVPILPGMHPQVLVTADYLGGGRFYLYQDPQAIKLANAA